MTYKLTEVTRAVDGVPAWQFAVKGRDGKERNYDVRAYPLPEGKDELTFRADLLEAMERRFRRRAEPGITLPEDQIPKLRSDYQAANEGSRPVSSEEKEALGAALAGTLIHKGKRLLMGALRYAAQIMDNENVNASTAIERASKTPAALEAMKLMAESFKLLDNVRRRDWRVDGDQILKEAQTEEYKVLAPLNMIFHGKAQKIATAMYDIDCVCEAVVALVEKNTLLAPISALIKDLQDYSKARMETDREDETNYSKIQTRYAASQRSLIQVMDRIRGNLEEANMMDDAAKLRNYRELDILKAGFSLIESMAFGRMPETKATDAFLARTQKHMDAQEADKLARTGRAIDQA